MVILPHGETNVTLACQNRCVSCNHFIPLQKPWHVDPAEMERDLNRAARVMHFGIYNTVGGEPTLHPDIVDLLKIIRRSGISDRVETTSNGQNFERLPDAYYQNLDDLIITPYKLSSLEREYIARKCREFNVRLEWHQAETFTYAAYRKPHDPATAAALYRGCWYAANRNVIDGGYFYRCCIGRFIPEMLLGLPREDDAIALEGLTEDKLRAFLHQSETPRGCYVCGSNCAPQFPWREQPDKNKWLDESLG